MSGADGAPNDILGPYELQESLGRGSMGTVYRARDSRTGATVAVKVLHPHLQHDPIFVSRFERESAIAAHLRSPFIVRTLAAAHLADGRAYLVTEYVEGERLSDRLRAGPMPLVTALVIATQVAQALQETAAQGIIHRDLKPDNILISRAGLAKVADFGIARLVDGTTLTQVGSFLGTVAYAAPEQFRGLADTRSDIYALGVTLFQMLSGEAPFRAATPTALMRLHEEAPPPLSRLVGIPPAVVEIVARCLAKRPEDRYQHAGELVVALEVAQQAVALHQESDLEGTRLWLVDEGEDDAAAPAPAPAAEDGSETPAALAWKEVADQFAAANQFDGALVGYRRALALAPAGSALAAELEQRCRSVAERVAPDPAAIAPPAPPAPVAAVESPAGAAATVATSASAGRRWWLAGGAVVAVLALAGLVVVARPWSWLSGPAVVSSPVASAVSTVSAASPGPALAAAPTTAAPPTPAAVTIAPTAPPPKATVAAATVAVRSAAAPPLATSLALSPDGQTLATGAADASVRLWRVSDGAPLRTLTGHVDRVTSIAFAPDGQTLATGSADTRVRLWRVADGSVLRELAGHEGRVTSLAFAPDGQTLATGSTDASVRLWRVSDGQALRTLTKHTDAVSSLAFAPDGQTLATGGYDQRVQVWRVADGAPLRTLDDFGSWVGSLAISPDGRLLATGTGDRAVVLWRLGDGQLARTLTGHTGPVLAVAFTPDGQHLVSGATDRSVRLWRIDDGELVRTLTGHTGAVQGLTVAPSGATAVSVGDQSARIWRLSDGTPLRTLDVVGGAPAAVSSATTTIANTATPGTVTVSATRFLPHERVAVWLTGPSRQILAAGARLTDSSGALSFPLRLPRHLEPGRWLATLHGLDSDWAADAPVEMPSLGPNATIDIQPAAGRPGASFQIRSRGFQPGERVAYWLTGPDNATVAGDVVPAGGDGLVAFTYATTTATAPGQWHISAYGLESDRLAVGAFNVG